MNKEIFMMGIILAAVSAAVVAGGIAGFAGWTMRSNKIKSDVGSAEAKAQAKIKEAEQKEQEMLVKAKEKALGVVDEAKKEERARLAELEKRQQRLDQRESLFDKKLLELEDKNARVQEKGEQMEKTKTEMESAKQELAKKLQTIAGMTSEEARTLLITRVEEKCQEDLMSRIHKMDQTAEEELEKKARYMLSSAIQRYTHSHVAETTTSVLQLPSDDMKGRIIGREGRNIKRIEDLTGVEIIVDDTPEAIVISGFSPIRRNLAKRTLEKLIADGRIQPAKIEQAVEEAKKELITDIRKAGEEAMREAGVTGLDPKLVQILGRLKYRTSYGQNNLRHSLEVSYLAAMLAEELGANVALARKAGLLHDLGKAADHDIQGTHPEIGWDIGKKFGLPQDLMYAAFAHHEDKPQSVEGVIVKVADAISGGRPGARKDSFEQYVQRLEELENVATSFEGIDRAYAIQAGREIRVFVNPDVTNDLRAFELAREIAKKIEAELKYPGEIKVTMIREKRIVEYAR